MTSVTKDDNELTENATLEEDGLIERSGKPGNLESPTPGNNNMEDTGRIGNHAAGISVATETGNDKINPEHNTDDVINMTTNVTMGGTGGGDETNGVGTILSEMEDELENNQSSNTDDTGRVSDLGDWKDRSQAAATSTLSIVQVGILKDILDGGPERYSYYNTGLALVSICLILEIICGFLIVSIYVMKSQLSRISPMKKTSRNIYVQRGSRDNEKSSDITVESLLTSISFVRNDTAALEQKLASAYRLCYAEELLSVLKLAEEHAIICSKRDKPSSLKAVIERANDVTTKTETHADITPIDMENLSKTLQNVCTARKQGEIILRAINMVRKQHCYDCLLYIQTALTYIFLVLTFLNVFLITFASPKAG